MRTNVSAAGNIGFVGFSTGGQTSSRATSKPMTSPFVVSGTWDSALSTDETEIRFNGANATESRPDNANLSACMLAAEPLVIGARYNSGSRMNGRISAIILAEGASAPPLTAISKVEKLLMDEWGL